jgi:periplasmic divalent cation tolerance protein
LVLCTAPAAEAEGLARRLLGERLAACVNLVGPVRSLYWWDGKVDSGEETLLVVKTARSRCAELQRSLLAWHSYESPEVLVFDVADGAPEYLAWVLRESVERQ